MVNTKKLLLSAITIRQGTKKDADYCHTPSWFTTNHNTLWDSPRLYRCNSPNMYWFIAHYISEVVIQKAIELFYYRKSWIYPQLSVSLVQR